MIQYFGIGFWGDNKFIRPCLSNIRLAMSAQYRPMEVLRNELIFLDEIYFAEIIQSPMIIETTKTIIID